MGRAHHRARAPHPEKEAGGKGPATRTKPDGRQAHKGPDRTGRARDAQARPRQAPRPAKASPGRPKANQGGEVLSY